MRLYAVRFLTVADGARILDLNCALSKLMRLSLAKNPVTLKRNAAD